MTLVQFAILSNVCGIAVVLLASFAVLNRHPQRFFVNWVQNFTGCFLLFSLNWFQTFQGNERTWNSLVMLVAGVTTWLFWRTGQALKGRPVSKILTGLLAAVVGVSIAAYAVTDWPLMPAFIAPVLIYTSSVIWLGVSMLRLGASPAGARSHWVGYPLIAMGLWAFSYPVLQGQPYFWVGYWLSGLLNISVGVGMLIFLLEHANRVLEQQNQQLKTLDQLKMNFLSTVSHELRTPLTSIIGYLELLHEGIGGPLNQQQTHFVEGMRRSSVQLSELVNALLDSMQMQAGRLKVECQPLEPGPLIEATLASFQPQCQKKGIRLEVDLAPLPAVMADPQRLTQVLNNLLSNAIKFTPANGRVSLTAVAEGEQLVVCVEDTGIGIAPDKLQQIFEPFYQADNTLTRAFGGSGLGLPIARTLLCAMGGEIDVESESGQGSRFRFRLPLAPLPSMPLDEAAPLDSPLTP